MEKEDHFKAIMEGQDIVWGLQTTTLEEITARLKGRLALKIPFKNILTNRLKSKRTVNNGSRAFKKEHR